MIWYIYKAEDLKDYGELMHFSRYHNLKPDDSEFKPKSDFRIEYICLNPPNGGISRILPNSIGKILNARIIHDMELAKITLKAINNIDNYIMYKGESRLIPNVAFEQISSIIDEIDQSFHDILIQNINNKYSNKDITNTEE